MQSPARFSRQLASLNLVKGNKAGIFLALCLAAPVPAAIPTISQQPVAQTVTLAATANFNVSASGTATLFYQWSKDGNAISGATASSLAVTNVQPADAGLYQVTVTNSTGSATSANALLGLTITGKVAGAGIEVGADILHPTGNIYDQILLQGTAAAITADPGQVTRISYLDLNDDIVQVEFAGAGTLCLRLDDASGPAPPANYNQPAVAYMKGHATIVIAGANETTNVSVFSVGRANAVNQALFRGEVAYDGIADIGHIAILSANGLFGGIRTANTSYFSTRGVAGIHAPGVRFLGPVFAGNINAYESAVAELVLGSGADVRITGGDLFQSNGQAVQVSGITTLQFADGSTSQGALLAAQPGQGRLEENGATANVQTTGPIARLYVARLRPATAATSSLASGVATLILAANGLSASVSASFSNLTTAQAAAHLTFGTSGAYVLNLPRGQFSNATWSFTPTGGQTAADLTNALKTGNISLSLDSALYPAGELQGSFIPATGSQSFVAPRPAPALPPGALGSPSQTDAARFLTAATFGPTKAGIDSVVALGIDRWITDQLALPASSHLAALRDDMAAFPNPTPPSNFQPYKATPANRLAAWWKIALTSPDQLRQRVAFALSEIFVISDTGCNLLWMGQPNAGYYDQLVTHGLGNFRQLLEAVALHPVMGRFLSHLANEKADPAHGTYPDENFAREVQQLFTVGLVQLHPDGTLVLDASGQPIPTYNQEMVSQTAKVFTGFTLAGAPAGVFRGFDPQAATIIAADSNPWFSPMQNYAEHHDQTEKRVLSLQQVSPAVAAPTILPAGQSGSDDLRMMLDTLFNHPNTGPFICRQLIQRLVLSNPSPGYLYRVAQVFANDGTGVRGNLAAVVRAILTDYEARSPDVTGNAGYGKIKEPLLRTTALLRMLNAAAPNGRFLDDFFFAREGQWEPDGRLARPANFFNQSPLQAATVFNFFSPDYAPPGALAAGGLTAPELQLIDGTFALNIPNAIISFLYRPAVTTGPTTSPWAGYAVNPPSPWPYLVMDYSAFLSNAGNPAALVDQLGLLLCANRVSTATHSRIVSALQSLASGTSDTDRVKTAIYLLAVSPDAALQN